MIARRTITAMLVSFFWVVSFCTTWMESGIVSGQTMAPPIAKIGSPKKSTHLAATADTLVLCPPSFIKTLDPWLAYRQTQGHNVFVLQPANSAYGIKRQIRSVAEFGNLQNVVIIGDAPHSRVRHQSNTVATDYVRAEVVSKYGSEPEIASDNTYADFDGDDLPDLAIGRIPVDTAKELKEQIEKIIRYETQQTLGTWKRQINFVAGTGGFGPLSDHVIEQTSKRLITELIPAEFQTSMTYASWSSPYCPDPRRFSETTLERLNEGCLFWVYMGHGHPRRLDFVRTPMGGYPIFRQADLASVHCSNGLPVAIMLACYTGAFDLPRDCLSEQLVRRSHGPIAVLGGSRVATPYGMSLLSLGLMEEYFGGSEQTLGQMLMVSKRKLVQSDLDLNHESDLGKPNHRRTIDLLGQALSPTANELNQERLEHAHLFHLLGDPLLRMPRPQRVLLTVNPQAKSGDRLLIKGMAPHAGRMTLELSYARDRMHQRPPRRSEFLDDPKTLADYQQIYQQANQKMCATTTISVSRGKFATALEIPEWAKGRCVIRAYLDEGNRFALGSAGIQIKNR